MKNLMAAGKYSGNTTTVYHAMPCDTSNKDLAGVGCNLN